MAQLAGSIAFKTQLMSEMILSTTDLFTPFRLFRPSLTCSTCGPKISAQ